MEGKENQTFLKTFTRGGQIAFHNMRMTSQIISILLKSCLLLGTLFFVFLCYSAVEPRQWQVFYTYHMVTVFEPFKSKEWRPTLHTPSGPITAPPRAILSAQGVQKEVKEIYGVISKAAIVSYTSIFIIFLLMCFVLFWNGKRQEQERHQRGNKIVNKKTLDKIIQNKGKVSDLEIDGISLPYQAETRSFLFLGSPGTGKTQGIFYLMDFVRSQHHPALIYDIEGVFTKYFFREGYDILLNITDTRCAPWTLWTDCTNLLDFKELASTLIPTPPQTDPFWNEAARIILSISLQRMSTRPDKSTGNILRYLTTADSNRIRELGKGTIIESMSDEKIEKIALSVKAILATHLDILRYLVEGENEFSIREWVKNPSDRCLFIASREEYHESLSPLLSTWVNIAISALLSLDENLDRRFWIFLDEANTLEPKVKPQRLPRRGRKRGCCTVFGLQDLASTDERFGHRASQIISSNTRNRIFYASTDINTATWISDSIGKQKITAPRESISYGADQVRDGISIQQEQRQEPLIMPEEIMQFPDFHAVLQIIGNYPVTKITLPLKNRTAISSDYIKRDPVDLMELIPDAPLPVLTPPPEMDATTQQVDAMMDFLQKSA